MRRWLVAPTNPKGRALLSLPRATWENSGINKEAEGWGLEETGARASEVILQEETDKQR